MNWRNIYTQLRSYLKYSLRRCPCEVTTENVAQPGSWFDRRWVRLLFGREFPFDDVLLIWDLLFAESLRLDLIDYTCVAMLLRIRWQRE
jgi:Rab-GTPase-TBC domain-containing protein